MKDDFQLQVECTKVSRPYITTAPIAPIEKLQLNHPKLRSLEIQQTGAKIDLLLGVKEYQKIKTSKPLVV